MAALHRPTPKKRSQFLEKLAERGSVVEACRAAGFARSTFYDLREKDPQFRADWNMAKEEYIDKLELEADRRAVEGVDHPVTYEGKITATYKDYSDNLLMFRLKGLAPEKYRENLKVSGSIGLNVEEVYAELQERMNRK